MSDKWDFYALRVDDKPASIMVDLGIADEAPIDALPFMAYIRVYMRMPRADGLSSQEEYQVLIAIEDFIRTGLAESREAVYVGRNTSDGCRDFYFYVARPDGWDQQAARFLRPFPGYEFKSGCREDSVWKTYFEFLYPSDEAMQSITNRWVCDSLESRGDLLTEKREIDHWLYFPTPDGRKSFLDAVLKLGFQLRQTSDPEKAGDLYGVQIYHIELPARDLIDDLTRPLFQLAAEFGGDYDGWETQVITRNS